MTADEVKKILGLVPHPREGGFYIRTYESGEMVPPTAFADGRYPSPRHTGTAIYYLLEPGTFSEMHRLRSDETLPLLRGRPGRDAATPRRRPRRSHPHRQPPRPWRTPAGTSSRATSGRARTLFPAARGRCSAARSAPASSSKTTRAESRARNSAPVGLRSAQLISRAHATSRLARYQRVPNPPRLMLSPACPIGQSELTSIGSGRRHSRTRAYTKQQEKDQ